MRVLCVRHVPYEGPGAIRQWAARRGHELAEVRAQSALSAPEDFDMLVVLGGPMGANDDAALPWLADEKEFIARTVRERKPVLGVCLGAQLLAVALGGRAFANPEPEIGWFPVTMTGAGRASRVLGGWPVSFMAGHWHGDTFEPPHDFPIAAISEACMRQAFASDDGRVVGLQFHLEWTEPGLAQLVEECGGDVFPSGHVQSAEVMLSHPELFEGTRGLLFELLDRMTEPEPGDAGPD